MIEGNCNEYFTEKGFAESAGEVCMVVLAGDVLLSLTEGAGLVIPIVGGRCPPHSSHLFW